jgi:SAM-dependent methyltransferase
MAFPSWLPLGLSLRDYYERGDAVTLRVFTIDGTATPYPAELFFREYDDFGIFDELACAEAYGHVLDVGAGAGCISLFLQDEMHMEVTAVEIAGAAVEVMRKRGVQDAREGDFFDLKGERWDTILLMMNGIGFVGNLAGLDRFLQHAKGLLAPGGQILFDSSDLAYADIDGEDFRGKESGYEGEVWYQLEYNGLKGAPYYWLYVDPHTARDHAEAAGYTFEVVQEAEEGYYLARLKLAEEAAR